MPDYIGNLVLSTDLITRRNDRLGGRRGPIERLARAVEALEAYGTSGGAKKGWDTRGRGSKNASPEETIPYKNRDTKWMGDEPDNLTPEGKDLLKKYPIAGDEVDGRQVRDDVPNMSSIGASFTNYEQLPDIREVPFSAFDKWNRQGTKPTYRDANEKARTLQLADEIKQNKEINPLIVGHDSKGPYIVEGSHRFDALRELGAKSFPAVVVRDLSDEMSAYGTSEGVKKEWDTRGRGRLTIVGRPQTRKPPMIGDSQDPTGQAGWFDPMQGGRLFHGTGQRKLDLSGKETYTALDYNETHAFARGEIPGAGGGPDPKTMVLDAKPGKTVDVSDKIDEAIMEGGEEDIQKAFDDARTQGAHYAYFWHPSSTGERDQFRVVVSLYPKDDLKSLGGWRLSGDKSMMASVEVLNAYGTSEGVKKAWDTRGRGRHVQSPKIGTEGTVGTLKGPDEAYKAYDQWQSYYQKFDPEGIGAGDPKNVQPEHAVGIMGDIVSSYERFQSKWDDDSGGFTNAEAMRDKDGNVMAALAMSAIGKKNVMLDYLAVHPAILSGEVPVKGIGTKMFTEAVKYAASQDKGLVLTALKGAEGFYRKCGMKEDGEIFSFDKQGVKNFLEKVGKS